MTRRLRILDSALRDITDISDFVAEQVQDAATGEAIAERLVARCGRLASLPGMLGSMRPDLPGELRSTPDGGYLILFRYMDDVLEIVAVVDGRRDLKSFLAKLNTG